MQIAKTIFLFSGQGSQYFQMGEVLYRENNNFRQWMHHIDAIARDLVGCSIVDTLYNDGHRKSDTFDRTLLSHPAIFMVEYALAQTLMEADVIPDITLGASMGAFAAAAISGYLNIEAALKAVVTQARLFEANCEKGGMIAILGNPRLYQDDIFKSVKDKSQLAARNYSSHFVISTKHDYLQDIESILCERRLTFQRLPVSFAYHSRWIDGAEVSYKSYLTSLTYMRATRPIICCARSEVLTSLSSEYFWTVAREPILFQQTIAQLEIQGSYRYIDVGPSSTLATFLKYALPPTSKSTTFSVLSPFGDDLKRLASVIPSSR